VKTELWGDLPTCAPLCQHGWRMVPMTLVYVELLP
jgi:hypothetical protein